MKFKILITFFLICSISLVGVIVYLLLNKDEKVEQDNATKDVVTIDTEEELSRNANDSIDIEPEEDNEDLYVKENKFQFLYPDTWRKVSYGDGLMPKEYCLEEICSTQIFSVIYKQLNENESYDLQTILDESFGLFPANLEEIAIDGNRALYAEYDTGTLKDLTWTVLSPANQLIQISFREMDNSRGEKKDYSKYTDDAKEMVESIEFLN